MKKYSYVLILVILSIILFISSFIPRFLDFLSRYYNNHSDWQNNILIVSTALLASTITIFWNTKSNRQKELETRGALTVEVTPEDVAILTNSGNVPISIISVSSLTHELPRSSAIANDIIDCFNNSKDFLVENALHRNMDISVGEKITLCLQEGANTAVEDKELCVQIIGIKYLVGDRQYTKYVGVYRLTSAQAWLIWQIFQKGNANFDFACKQIREVRGKRYPASFFPDYIFQQLDKDSSELFEKESVDDYHNIYQIYLDKLKTKKDNLPEDKWYIFRIEDR